MIAGEKGEKKYRFVFSTTSAENKNENCNKIIK